MNELEAWEAERAEWRAALAPTAERVGAAIEVTCTACPTQADLTFPDGRYGYFRYRFGRWTLSLYPDNRHGIGSPVVCVGEDWREERGDLDGMLDPSELAELLERAVPDALRYWEEMV